VRSLTQTAVDEFGGIDVLVNCHGLDFHSRLESTEVDDVREVFEVNFLGVFLTMKYAAPLMTERGAGSIINIGSRLGQVAIPGQAVYGASKAAVAQLTRGAAIDLAADGIRVNCVAPGITNTEMIGAWVRDQPDPAGFEQSLVESIPMRRMASPDDIAGAVAFLASDDARYITGAVLSVDGGYTAQ
jgi:meso-butanediol dehydrogenase/(S,S)-butanediol dehydrogenase/diacetyl reductase